MKRLKSVQGLQQQWPTSSLTPSPRRNRVCTQVLLDSWMATFHLPVKQQHPQRRQQRSVQPRPRQRRQRRSVQQRPRQRRQTKAKRGKGGGKGKEKDNQKGRGKGKGQNPMKAKKAKAKATMKKPSAKKEAKEATDFGVRYGLLFGFSSVVGFKLYCFSSALGFVLFKVFCYFFLYTKDNGKSSSRNQIYSRVYRQAQAIGLDAVAARAKAREELVRQGFTVRTTWWHLPQIRTMVNYSQIVLWCLKTTKTSKTQNRK